MTTATGQTIFETYQNLSPKADRDILSLQNSVDSLLRLSLAKKELQSHNDIARNYALALYRKKHFSKAIAYESLEIEQLDQQEIKDDSYVNGHYLLGVFYKRLDNIQMAQHHFEMAILPKLVSKRSGQSYTQIGRYYKIKGDFQKAIAHYTKGIDMLEQLGEFEQAFGKILDLVGVYDDMKISKSEEVMEKLLQRAKVMSKRFELNEKSFYHFHIKYGDFYNNIEHLDVRQSSDYYLKVLEKAGQMGNSEFVGKAYNNLGNLYVKAKNDSALFFLKESLKQDLETEDIAKVHHNISDHYSQKKDYKQALKHIQNALVTSTKISRIPDSLPDVYQVLASRYRYDILERISTKANVLLKLAEQTGDKNMAQLTLDHVYFADQLIEHIQNESFAEDSQIYWREDASYVYPLAIKACELLEKPAAAFYFSEKNKALLLTEAILANDKKQELPTSILDRETLLKNKINSYAHTEVENASPKEMIANRDSLFDTRRVYEEFIDSVKTVFPEFYEKKEKTNIIPLATIQNDLNADTVLLSYVWNTADVNSNRLFFMMVSKTDISILEIVDLQKLNTLIDTFQQGVSTPFETATDQKHFRENAYQLFQHLFGDIKLQETLLGKQLIIIPDGKLLNIPFEALITDQNTYPYLIQTSEVSYAYSASFLMHNKKVSRNGTSGFAGFAPVSFENTNLNQLNESANEVSGILKMLQGSSFIDTMATKANFFEKTKNANIIHLATHAEASNDPWIAFKKEKLSVQDLYLSRNQAELVVLSACSTSLGINAEGEGVMSLARGFFYAGANTVVSTLWDANDKATSHMMTAFYGYLKEGKTKSRALHLAKLDYIQTHVLSDVSPHYWAPFVLIGDSETILYTSDNKFIYGALLLLGILIIGLLFFRRKTQKVG
jgi:CHAT domain-containing protein